MLDIGVNAIEEIHQGTSAFETMVRNYKDHFIVDGQSAVPKQVCDMMLGYWEVNPAERVAVLCSPELAIRAIVAGYTDVTYVGINITGPTRAVFADLSIKCATLEEFKDGMKKFDFGLVNPPYSEGRGNKLLYPDFFRICLENCEDFIMVMPVDLETRQPKLKKHNHLVKKHCSYISENVTEHFNVGMKNIHYVVASKSVENEVLEAPTMMEKLQNVPLLRPRRGRVPLPLKGTGSCMFGTKPTGQWVEVIDKVHKDGNLVTHKERVSDIRNWKCKSDSTWILLLNHTPSKGKFNYSVVKNDGTKAFGSWVFPIEVPTKKAGLLLGEYLQSKKVAENVSDMLKANNNTHTANREMIARLPWFE